MRERARGGDERGMYALTHGKGCVFFVWAYEVVCVLRGLEEINDNRAGPFLYLKRIRERELDPLKYVYCVCFISSLSLSLFPEASSPPCGWATPTVPQTKLL